MGASLPDDITNSNLEEPLEIDREHDFVNIYSYIGESVNSDYIAFGNHPDSDFLLFREGHSIARIDQFGGCLRFYSLDNTPSIGENNLADGVSGTVSGYLFDGYHNPVPDTKIFNYICEVTTDENGYYEGNVLSRTYIFDSISIWTDQREVYIFEPDTINVFPDSTYYTDIVLLSHYIDTSTHDTEYSSIYYYTTSNPGIITSFPNPFKDYVSFYIALSGVDNFNAIDFQIFNANGQKVYSIPLSGQYGSINLSSGIVGSWKAGIYYYRLLIDGKPSDKLNTFIKL